MAIDSDTGTDVASGALDEEFWRGLEHGVVAIPRCSTCNRWVWPARPLCPRCCTDTIDWTEVAATGVVYSWTRTWYEFVPERSDDLPYVVTVVELNDAPGVRLLGIFDGPDHSLIIGAEVRGHVEPPSAATYGLPSLRWTNVA